ncbi:MAG: hypothetical protein Fur0041_16320 [Bacteroidia bacterium]
MQANNIDILTLGVTFGATGTTRANASNAWNAQPSADWNSHIPLGANHKHSDCNGDGVVDWNDTLAVNLNYAQTHTFRLNGNDPLPDVQSTLPSLYLVPQQDTVGPANYVYIDVYGGNQASPINDLYGLAFTLNYINALVQPGTVAYDFSGSWLGVKNSTMVTVSNDQWNTSHFDVGMCRVTHTEMNGYGYLGTIRLAAAAVTSLSTLNLSLSNIKAINGFTTNIPLTTEGCTVVIDPSLPAATEEHASLHTALFPNPSNGIFTVSSSDNITSILITDAAGRTVYAGSGFNSNTAHLDLKSLPSGVYFMNTRSKSKSSITKLIIE